jgi:tetratricopeptide (TPR) repeat protein
VRAARWQDEAVALHRKLGDRWGATYSIFLLGYVAAAQRDWANARSRFEDSVEAFRELGDEHFTLLATQNLAWMCEELGDMDRGSTLREEVLELARAAGNQRMEAMALQGLAFHAWEACRFEDALSLIAAGYRIHADLGERDMIAGAISRFARVHAAAGRPLTAAQLLSSAKAYDELGESSIPWIRDLNSETLAMIRAKLDEAALEWAWQEGRTMTPDEALALALASPRPMCSDFTSGPPARES